MKIVIFSALLLALVASATPQGFPTRECPKGEHPVVYCPRMAEPSCDNPTIHKLNRPAACDIVDCWCNTGTLRNTANKKCIKPENCP